MNKFAHTLAAAAGALVLFDTAVAAAQTCSAAPSCESLKYTETAASCRGKYIVCPFDATKVSCLNDGPRVGDLKYSLFGSNHDGWLKCDGTQYSQTAYAKLFGLISTNFCHKYTSRTDANYTTNNCKTGYFAVPDYRGFFLRGANIYNPSSNTVGAPNAFYGYALYYKGYANTLSTPWIPQYEQLPSITGRFGMVTNGANTGWNTSVTDSGAFFRSDGIGDSGPAGASGTGGVGFDASRSNPIYDGGHVMPASYNAYIFIYAGK